MERLKKYKSQFYFHLVMNLIIAVFITYASYYHTPLHTLNDYLFYLIHLLIVQFSVFGFIYFLSIHKIIFYIFFSLFFIFFSLFAYNIYVQDISVTQAIIQAIIETKFDIAIDIITPIYIGYFIVVLILLISVLKMRQKLKINQLKSPMLILAILGIITFFVVEKKRANTLNRRMPFSLIVGLKEYYSKTEYKLSEINQYVNAINDKTNIVFILGESVRADHLQLNNYERNTTPLLNKRKNLISFSNMYTPLTYTAVSVPQILTNLSIDKKKPKSIYSVYSVLNKANYKTTWLGNQTPEKSYDKYINENDEIHILDPFHSVLSFQKKKDHELLPLLKTAYKNTNKHFITLHMIGSHWWYESRYTKEFKQFTPVIKSKYIPSNSLEEMVNSYDNSILYLDNFIDNVISIIEKDNQNTLLIYVADHGEQLGEEGKWLHAQNGKSSQNPAVLIWYSDKFKEVNINLVKNLENNKDKHQDFDFFYHSILDILQVEGIDYDTSKSIFNNYHSE